MVESICGQGFAYAREVEEERLKKTSQTRAKRSYRQKATAAEKLGQNLTYLMRPASVLLFIAARASLEVLSKFSQNLANARSTLPRNCRRKDRTSRSCIDSAPASSAWLIDQIDRSGAIRSCRPSGDRELGQRGPRRCSGPVSGPNWRPIN
jgi:hypothetical protein